MSAVAPAAATAAEAVLQEALAAFADLFEADDDVPGADLVEWFVQWRVRAKAALGRDGAP